MGSEPPRPSIALVNPNTSRATTERMVAIAAAFADPLGFEVVGRTAETGAPLITDAAGLEVARGAMKALLPELRADSCAAAIVSAFGDPGLAELRAGLAYPVVGIGESGMLEAAGLGGRIAVVTTTPGLAGSIDAMAARLGLASRYAGVVLTPGDPVALTADAARLEAALAAATERAICEHGADVIVIGGGPLAVAARSLAPRFTVPIVEPIPAAVRAVAGEIDRRRRR